MPRVEVTPAMRRPGRATFAGLRAEVGGGGGSGDGKARPPDEADPADDGALPTSPSGPRAASDALSALLWTSAASPERQHHLGH